MNIDPLAELKKRREKFSTQKELAEDMKLSVQHVSDMLLKRRSISKTVLNYLGLKKRVVYERR